jgi:hypothetical protein
MSRQHDPEGSDCAGMSDFLKFRLQRKSLHPKHLRFILAVALRGLGRPLHCYGVPEDRQAIADAKALNVAFCQHALLPHWQRYPWML